MNLCDKCKYPCFVECPANYADVEYDGSGTSKNTVIQCDIFENANLNEPRGVWAMDKNIEDFKQIAYNLRREGYVSRADAIMYLIERVKIAEGRMPPGGYVITKVDSDDETRFGNYNLAKDFLLKMREEKPENNWYMYGKMSEI